MDQIALYRKYRPQNFDNLIGQKYVKTTLINGLKSGHVAHAYLFSGPRGTGKTSSARLIAKALNCTDLKDKFEPCDKCEFCIDINDGRLIDLIEVDAASNRGIDEVRDLKEKINFAPSRSKYKVYIIDEVHMMTKEAFNALLKTLEEPPSHAYFILATTEIHKIPDTIISRCQRFDFKRISQKDLIDRLSHIAKAEKVTAEDRALELIARYVDGGMRDAIGLLEQLTVDSEIKAKHVQEILGVSDISLLANLLTALEDFNTSAALKVIHELHDQGSDLKKFTHEFIDDLRGKMIDAVNSKDLKSVKRLMDMIEIFQVAYQGLNTATLPQLPLEIAIIKISGKLESVAPVQIPVKQAVAAPVASVSIQSAPIATTARRAPVASRVQASQPPIPARPAAQSPAPSDHTPAAAESKPMNQAEPEQNVAAPSTANDREHKSISSIDLETIRDAWPRITERIKTPSLRMSLKGGVPIRITEHNLLVQFSTNFHRDKVMEHDYRTELESVFNEVLNFAIKVEAIVKAIEIKPTIEEDRREAFTPPPPMPPEMENSMPPAKTAAIDAALDIFGGEVIG